MPIRTEQQLAKELAVIDFVLEQGARGHHLLFSEESLRRHFSTDPEEQRRHRDEHRQEINRALNHSLVIRGIQAKKEYFASLPPEVQGGLIYTYFEALDGKIRRNQPRLH